MTFLAQCPTKSSRLLAGLARGLVMSSPSTEPHSGVSVSLLVSFPALDPQVSTRATVNQGKRHFSQIFHYRGSLELSGGWLPTKVFFFLSLLPAPGSPRSVPTPHRFCLECRLQGVSCPSPSLRSGGLRVATSSPERGVLMTTQG